MFIFSLFLILTACNKKSHVHNFVGDYETDEFYHWQVCECGEKNQTAHGGSTATCQVLAKCSVCSVSYGHTLEHVYDQEIIKDEFLAKEVTCLTKAKYYHSCVCGAIGLTKFEVGETLGHSFTDYIFNNDSTCLNNGTKTAKCDRCDILDTQIADDTKLGHELLNYVSNNDATCLVDGTKTAECERCNECITVIDLNSKLGHSFTSYTSNSDATCLADGTKSAKCDYCGVVDTILEEDSELGHSFTNYVSNDDRTCLLDGTKTSKCDNCDAIDTILELDSKLGHSFTNYTSNSDATCLNDGTITAKCENCDALDTQIALSSKLPHNTDILNYNKDFHWNECLCGFIDEKTYIEHNYNDGEITLAPTDKNQGTRLYSCLDCGSEKESIIQKIDGIEVEHYPSLSNAEGVYYNGNIYVYGGSPDGSNRTNAIHCFNVISKKVYKLNVELPNGSTSHRVVLIEDKVYIFGGLNKGVQFDTVLVHDLTNNTLETYATLPFGLNCFQFGVYDNKAYIVGGSVRGYGSTNHIFEFDFVTKQVIELDVTLPTVVFKGGFCAVDKYLYLFGGTSGKRLTTIYRFDMENHEVSTMNATMPYPISQSRAVYDFNGKIYIYGGTVEEGNALQDSVFVYDINDDICTQQEYKLPYPLANICAISYLENGKTNIFVLGGDNEIIDTVLKQGDNEIIEYLK